MEIGFRGKKILTSRLLFQKFSLMNLKVNARRELTLSEYEEGIFEEIDSASAEAITKSELVEISRKISGEFRIVAGSRVGFVAAGNLQIAVHPRLPVRNLFYLLNVLDEVKFEQEEVQLGKSEQILDILVASFVESAYRSTSKGNLHGYREIEEPSIRLKGKLLFSKQLKRGLVIPIPFEILREEYSEDIPENQLLKRALRKVIGLNLGDTKYINVAKSLLRNLEDVSDVYGKINYVENRINRHYWNTLRIARLFDEGSGFNQNLGDLAIKGFHIDMFRLFEQFSFREFSSRIRNRGDVAFSQKRLELDLDGNYKEIPDLIWQSKGKPLHVIDFKYKNPIQGEIAKPLLEDIRQVSSYASLLSLEKAHIVYGVPINTREIPTKLGVTVFAHGIDLSLKPNDISKQLDDLIFEIGR